MQRVHADYCGPFLDRYYALVVEDAYSKFPEVFLTPSATATFTKRALRRYFAREGIPQALVTDNGTHFTGEEVQSWLRSIGCRSVFTAPRHPQSNGLAERFVRTLKTAIAAAEPMTKDDLEQAVDSFLLQYRNAAHPTTKKSPAALFKGRNLRTPADLESTDVLFYRGNNARPCQGLLLGRLGNRMYNVLDRADGTVHRRHVEQFEITADATPERDEATTDDPPEPPPPSPSPGDDSDVPNVNPEPDITLRRSVRERRPPARYKDFITTGRSCNSEA